MTLKLWWNKICSSCTSENKNDRWKMVKFLHVSLKTHSELFPKALTSLVFCPLFCQTIVMGCFSWGGGNKTSIVRFTRFSSSFTSLPILLSSPLLIHLLYTVLQQQWLNAPAMSFWPHRTVNGCIKVHELCVCSELPCYLFCSKKDDIRMKMKEKSLFYFNIKPVLL